MSRIRFEPKSAVPAKADPAPRGDKAKEAATPPPVQNGPEEAGFALTSSEAPAAPAKKPRRKKAD